MIERPQRNLLTLEYVLPLRLSLEDWPDGRIFNAVSLVSLAAAALRPCSRPGHAQPSPGARDELGRSQKGRGTQEKEFPGEASAMADEGVTARR